MATVSDPSVEGNSQTRLFYRFSDLKRLGIVSNWMTLRRWTAAGTFPAGVMLGPNVRAWPAEQIDQWIASRPVAKVGA